ncbi:MAG: phospholipase D-like domain-containing protein [Pseudomonadota bacterium]
MPPFDSVGPAPLVQAGRNCWRLETAQRIAVLVDNEAYYAAVYEALQRARRSILLLGWHFDPRDRLLREGEHAAESAIGTVLQRLADERPGLDIRILIWEVALPMTVKRDLYPKRAASWFRDNVRFVLDDRHPIGACHHQKVLVIDDRLAFVSGDDFEGNRWDSRGHLDHDPRRREHNGEPHPPRHSVTLMVEGEAARALGDLFRERWLHATGETLAPPPMLPQGEHWPADVASRFEVCPVALARTVPEYKGLEAVKEIEALVLDAIASARRLLYIENQYFASETIAEAIARRLAEPDGPEIVAVLSLHAPNRLDKATMDAPRNALVARLRGADCHGRLHVYAPHTPGGRPIVVHSKVMIVDDRLLCVGSANLNNRSMSFDTECNLCIDVLHAPEPEQPALRRAVTHTLYDLVGHYIDVAAQDVAEAAARAGGLAAAIETLQQAQGARRLKPLPDKPLSLVESLIAELHIGDPRSRRDSFRPWRRA